MSGSDLGGARGASGLLRAFDEAGLFGLADVHTAQRLAVLGREPDQSVQLAVAFAVRALRHGSACIDLSTVSRTVVAEGEEPLDVSALPWPVTADWSSTCERSPLVACGPDAPPDRPMRLAHGLLYLDRYWRQQERVRRELQQRAAATPPPVDVARLRVALDRLFPGDGSELQRLAATVSALRWVSVLAGGPGTETQPTATGIPAVRCSSPPTTTTSGCTTATPG